MTLTELFHDFTFKPNDLVQLKVQAAGQERLEALRIKHEAEATAIAEKTEKTGLYPVYTAAAMGNLPVVFQISSRSITEKFGGIMTTEYYIEGDDGQKLTVHEDELIAHRSTVDLSPDTTS